MQQNATPCDQNSNKPLVTIYDEKRVTSRPPDFFFALIAVQKPPKLLRSYNFMCVNIDISCTVTSTAAF